MNSRRLAFALAALAALFVSACKPDWPKCDTTDQCNVDGHAGVCVDGVCTECAEDTDCKAGFRCDKDLVKGHRCVPAAECSGASDCPGGKVCTDGKCEACTGDGQCGAGSICDAGACRVKAECAGDSDCKGGLVCIDNKCSRPPEAPRCDTGAIRFGFNEYSLSESTKSSLQKLADCLKKDQAKADVTIEGHCDDRGTEEYNMALGDKRATAVKKYLGGLGISATRLRTVSYGEERPSSRSADEDGWAQNRRAEFVVTGQK